MTRALTRPPGVSLAQARVCLDCDCLTVEQSCPWCDRDSTVPLSAWFRPMEPGRADSARQGQPDEAASHRWVLVVQHHQRDLYRVLRQALAGTAVEVLYERRVGQRRRAAIPSADERRRTDRRRPRPSASVYEESAVAVPKRESSLRRGSDQDTVEVVRPRRRQPASV
jgi:hypothetical protein